MDGLKAEKINRKTSRINLIAKKEDAKTAYEKAKTASFKHKAARKRLKMANKRYAKETRKFREFGSEKYQYAAQKPSDPQYVYYAPRFYGGNRYENVPHKEAKKQNLMPRSFDPDDFAAAAMARGYGVEK